MTTSEMLTNTAFIWNQGGSIQNLEQVLTTDYGLSTELAGWTLNEATAITPDGNTIVGIGFDPERQEEGWIVNLSAPPQHGPHAPTITWSNPAGIVYGTKLGSAQLDALASVPGTFTYSPAAGTVLHAGKNQSLSVTFTPTDTTDYTTATATVRINVSQATPTITWANPANIFDGIMLGPAQLDATASVPGILTYSPPNGKILAAGNNQTLSVSFTPTDTTDYTDATASVTINVLPVIPPPPVGQIHKTKIVVTAKPRFAIPGRPIFLTATVINRSHKARRTHGSASLPRRHDHPGYGVSSPPPGEVSDLRSGGPTHDPGRLPWEPVLRLQQQGHRLDGTATSLETLTGRVTNKTRSSVNPRFKDEISDTCPNRVRHGICAAV